MFHHGEVTAMQCQKCASWTPDGANFCNACGERLSREGGKEEMKRSATETFFKAAVVVALAVMALFVFFRVRDLRTAYRAAPTAQAPGTPSAKAPAGMFGASWLMTKDQVRKACGRCGQLDPNTLVQQRVLYDRQVAVRYVFLNGGLVQIVAAFPEKSFSEDSADLSSVSAYLEYLKVQDGLSKEYGQMPDAVISKDKSGFKSEMEMGGTTLVHQLNATGDKRQGRHIDERVVMYKNGGA